MGRNWKGVYGSITMKPSTTDWVGPLQSCARVRYEDGHLTISEDTLSASAEPALPHRCAYTPCLVSVDNSKEGKRGLFTD